MYLQQLDRYERMPISTATRTLLCDFATGDVQRPLHYVEADWGEVFQAICRHGLLGLTYHYLQQWEPQDYPAPEFRQMIQKTYRLSATRMAQICQQIRQVLAQLQQSGLDYLVIKGPAVAHAVYPHPLLRNFNDLDIVVRERDWTVAHRLLTRMEFVVQEGGCQPPPKLVPQAVTSEQGYWHPDRRLLVEVHYDDLLNAGLASRNIEGFWQRAVSIEVEGLPLKVLSLEDQLIHLCAHIHFHGYTRLSWFADIAFIIRDHAAELDWERLLKTVRIEEAEVAVYYSLHFLEQFLEVSAPKEVLAALRPDRFRCWWHERYLPEERVLSLDPMPRPDFSFYFLPLFKRLLPDLLVMGRRREKLHYLLRLLLPSPAWLQAYYRLDSKKLVGLYYLLHPLRLIYHYVTEVVVTIIIKRHRLGVP